MVSFQVIFFNAGGTLIQLNGTTIPTLYSQLISQVLQKQISPEEIYHAFRKADSWVLTRKNPGALFSDLDQRKYQNVFYGHLKLTNRKKINQIEKQIAEELELDFVLEKGARKILQELKSKFKLGIISNWDESLREILHNLDILEYFDSITLSGDIGISKPSLEIFRSALSDFPDVKTKETVYIGDDYQCDIIPAQNLNIFAILFDKGPSGMHGRPFQTKYKGISVKELSKLPSIIKKYNNLH